MKKTKAYTDEHASSGVHTELPAIETWPNQYSEEYEIEIIRGTEKMTLKIIPAPAARRP